MGRTTSLVWKEWRESRWLLAAGLGVFVALPLIGTWQARTAGHQRFIPLASVTVLLLGPVAALLFAVAAVGRDVSDRVEDFWRSRPVGVGRWLGAKFAVGLAEVLFVLALPLVVEAASSTAPANADSFARALLGWAPFQWVGLYGVGFAVACLVRRPAHAAAVGVAAVVLVCFGPIVLRPLERLSIPWLMEHAVAGGRTGRAGAEDGGLTWHGAAAGVGLFAAVMVGVAAAAFAVGVRAVARGWEVRSGPRLMYAAVGAVLLLLVGTAAAQYGNNLPVLQTIDLEPGEQVVGLRVDGVAGVALTVSDRTNTSDETYALRRLTLTGGRVVAGPAVRLRPEWRVAASRYGGDPHLATVAWRADRPDEVRVWAGRWFAWAEEDGEPQILTLTLDPAAPDPLVRREAVRLQYTLGVEPPPAGAEPIRFPYHGDVYPAAAVVEPDAARGDATGRADAPLVWLRPIAAGRWWEGSGDRRTFRFTPMIAGPVRAALHDALPDMVGDVLHQSFSSDRSEVADVSAWRLEALEPLRLDWRWHPVVEFVVGRIVLPLPTYGATFRRLGGYEPTFVDRAFGLGSSVTAGGRYVYLTDRSGGYANRSRLKVLDFGRPEVPRSAGHFATPDKGPLVVAALPDDRVLVGGTGRLYLLGPPSGR